MSKNQNKKLAKLQQVQAKKDQDSEQVVKMKFKEDKFYNDQTVPYYEKGKVYEVRGADMIQRWLKRGGEIVEGELEFPEHEVNPSTVVDPAGDKDPSGEVDNNENAGDGDDSQDDEDDKQE